MNNKRCTLGELIPGSYFKRLNDDRPYLCGGASEVMNGQVARRCWRLTRGTAQAFWLAEVQVIVPVTIGKAL